MANEDLINFIDKDHLKTLFPLRSTQFIAKYGYKEILTYINEFIFKENNEKNHQEEFFFLSQPLVYAAKNSHHLRQCFFLDPIAVIYLYDFVFRNSKYFQMQSINYRQRFGYSFTGNKSNSSTNEYKAFRDRISELKIRYSYLGMIDISNCFNNIYHHDLKSYLCRKISNKEGSRFGKYLREINEGRSTSCMPQGYFPIKVIGNHFLSFIEQSREIKSEHIVRFMDDIYLFSHSMDTIKEDIFVIQRLIGEKGLSLNEEKTFVGNSKDKDNNIGDIKKSLLEKRRTYITSYLDDYEEDEVDLILTEEETLFLKELLHNEKSLLDEDIELILSLLINDLEETLDLVELVLENSPHLTKALYHHLRKNDNIPSNIIDIFDKFLENVRIQEFQLFWITKIMIDYFEINEDTIDLLFKIYFHSSASNIIKCLILELNENNYGLLEIKQKVARGAAPELVISALIGLLNHEKSNRNHIYNYVGKSSKFMKIITEVLKKIDIKEDTDLYLNKKKEVVLIKKAVKKNQSLEFLFGDSDDDDLPF
ncbi:RNA-directed DNA polymerase [Metabacillus hrfriensis]|uniref:RNA-directed DNA polymerase n=1 Tax=Metabacillus hrfriensis TaxID=3048891 RepID=A0ACD4RE61_9BACI|nr:RNA-directed DNA polymerase [Metabacillus sp. CT-WN-B3]WHZ58777.1 RNA-directed DNA polymerase [Metabacillus sp. CT-WN-B3]